MSWARDDAKLERVRALMAEEELNALVVRAPDNVLNLRTFWGRGSGSARRHTPGAAVRMGQKVSPAHGSEGAFTMKVPGRVPGRRTRGFFRARVRAADASLPFPLWPTPDLPVRVFGG